MTNQKWEHGTWKSKMRTWNMKPERWKSTTWKYEEQKHGSCKIKNENMKHETRKHETLKWKHGAGEDGECRGVAARALATCRRHMKNENVKKGNWCID